MLRRCFIAVLVMPGYVRMANHQNQGWSVLWLAQIEEIILLRLGRCQAY